MPTDKATKFRRLHCKNQPLILINIWDSASAAIVQKSGSSALATSSAAIAWANGYSDGSALPQSVMTNALERIIRTCRVPLTVDVEGGYSNCPYEVAKFVSSLVELGVAGINIEDGDSAPSLLIEKILAIRSNHQTEDLFINARTDVYLQQLVTPKKRLNETITRLQTYTSNGADGVFVPGLSVPHDIATILSSNLAPLNVMASPDSDNLKELIDSGVSRVSLGPATFIDAYSTLAKTSEGLMESSNTCTVTYDALNNLF